MIDLRVGKSRTTVKRRGLLVYGSVDRRLWIRPESSTWTMPYRARLVEVRGLTERAVRRKLRRALG